MGRRRLLWVAKVLQSSGNNAWEAAERMIPSHTVRGKKDGNVQTLAMSDRKRVLVKKWVASSSERRKW